MTLLPLFVALWLYAGEAVPVLPRHRSFAHVLKLQYNKIQYNTVQNSTAQYSTVWTMQKRLRQRQLKKTMSYLEQKLYGERTGMDTKGGNKS